MTEATKNLISGAIAVSLSLAVFIFVAPVRIEEMKNGPTTYSSSAMGQIR